MIRHTQINEKSTQINTSAHCVTTRRRLPAGRFSDNLLDYITSSPTRTTNLVTSSEPGGRLKTTYHSRLNSKS